MIQNVAATAKDLLAPALTTRMNWESWQSNFPYCDFTGVWRIQLWYALGKSGVIVNRSFFLRRLFHIHIPCLAAISLIILVLSVPAFCFRDQAGEQNHALNETLGESVAPDPDNNGQSKQKPGSALSDHYRKWLNEEVSFIITPEERKIFLSLLNDMERENFLEQFWARRNPHPRSSKNEFKDEHYRRIDYANRHFAETQPGWKTDRGRVYIIHGKPARIQSIPREGHRIPDRRMKGFHFHLKSGNIGILIMLATILRLNL
jgi:GWxTD domain-containing protein